MSLTQINVKPCIDVDLRRRYIVSHMAKKKEFTEDEVRGLLEDLIGKTPVSAWARSAGLSNGYVQDFIHGRSGPGDKILKLLGLERATTYRYVAVKR